MFIILGNITSFIVCTAVPLTLAPSRIAHLIVLAGICSPVHSIVMMSLASLLALRLFANTCKRTNHWTISNSSLTNRTNTARASPWCVLTSTITDTGGWCANSAFTFAASISWMKWIYRYVRRCDSSVNLADPSSNKAQRWVILAKGIPAFRNTWTRLQLALTSALIQRHVLDLCHWGHQHGSGSNFSTLSPAATPEPCELLLLYSVGQRRPRDPERCFSLGTGSYDKRHNRAARLKR